MRWRRRELKLEKGSCCTFHHNYQSSSAVVELPPVAVRSAETIKLKAETETSVLCNLETPLWCNEVLIEPITWQTELVGVCRIITRPKTHKQVVLTLCQNQKFARANPNFEVQSLEPESGTRKIHYKTDETLYS